MHMEEEWEWLFDVNEILVLIPAPTPKVLINNFQKIGHDAFTMHAVLRPFVTPPAHARLPVP